MKKLFIVFVVLFYLISCKQEIVIEDDSIQWENQNLITINESCVQNGGTWLADFKECEYINSDWCNAENWSFNECASACRNNPEAEMCTMQCVPVCSLKPKPKMHESWDVDWDGTNDCEKDGICDHTVDYTKPRE